MLLYVVSLVNMFSNALNNPSIHTNNKKKKPWTILGKTPSQTAIYVSDIQSRDRPIQAF